MIDKNTFIKVKFGAFEFSGDIIHLTKAIDELVRLKEDVNVLEEPEDVGKVYG